MKDEDKTEEQLISELVEMRQKLAEFKASGTGYNQTEEALREAQQMLQLVMDNIQQAIFWKDRKSVYLGCNRAYAASRGLASPEEVLGKTDYDLSRKNEEAESFREYDRQVMETNIPKYHTIETQVQSDGTEALLDTSKVPLQDSEGNVIGILGTYEDITERKRMEEELKKHRNHLEQLVKERTAELIKTNDQLQKEISERKRVEMQMRESQEKYSTIFEQAADSIVLIDTETGALVEFNEKAHNNLGYTRKGFERLKIPDFEVIESVEQVARHIEKIVKEGGDIFETKHRTKSGEIREIQVSSRAISIRGRVFVQSIWRDITELKKAEEKIKASLKEKEVLLQEIHHRVKNNMQVVSSLLKLQAGRMKDEKARQAFKESRSRVSAMALVHEALYRSDSMAEIELQKHIPVLINSIYRILRIKHRVDLKVDIEDIKLSIGQATPLSLVINELISNSLQHAFAEGKGEIIVKVRSSGDDEIEVVISDDGRGMPADIDSDKSLGLQLVTGLVESQLDGTWEVISEEGTQHTIRFKKK